MDLYIWLRPYVAILRAAGESFFFQYNTPRVVTLKNAGIGIIYRLFQLFLLTYIIGYVFVYRKSYQKIDAANSSVVSKIKGVLQRNVTVDNRTYTEIWDSSDFVIPAQESDAFFVATNLIYTLNQTQGVCSEDINVGENGIRCSNDRQCPAGLPTPYGNGIRTGRCIIGAGTCEISAWCPTETDIAPRTPELFGHASITILVKNHISFRKFGVKRRNILPSFQQRYLETCRWDPVKDPLCPIFALTDIYKFIKQDFGAMAIKGGIIGFGIEWICNLDYGEDKCLPMYSFKRLDNTEDKISKGWNFRTTVYYYDANGISRRDLIKLWGIRFVFLVSGQAGKFSPLYFFLHVGAGVGLFGGTCMFCEAILKYYCRYFPQSDLLSGSKFIKLEELKARRKSSAQVLPGLSSSLSAMNNAFVRSPRPSLIGDHEQSGSATCSVVVTPVQDRKNMIRLNDSTIFLEVHEDDEPQWV